MVLAKTHPHKKTPLLYVGGVLRNAYFIPMDITEDVFKSVVRKLLGRSGPRNTDPDSLPGIYVWPPDSD